jgi:hypothetical protein
VCVCTEWAECAILVWLLAITICSSLHCRAKFSYLPRKQKELRVDYGNVFHILDDSPMVKGDFRVSRLNDDGTDAEQGTIPNSFRAFHYVQNQGQGGCGCYRRCG